MELFGILCSVPAAFVGTAIYAYLARLAFRHEPVKRIALLGSELVLFGLLLEWAMLLTVGAVRSRTNFGPAFYPVHLVLFFLAVPALANLLIIKKGETAIGKWYVVALLCTALALPVVLTQVGVAEALYGIDDTGGPYGHAPTMPMPAWW